jgi:hypothetical protein
MKRLLLPLCAIALCAAALGTTAVAQSHLSVGPDQSVGVLSEDPGSGERWSETILPFGNYVGPDTGSDVFCRTYLRFPLGAIPADATIESATLQVYVDDWSPDAGSAPMSVYGVSAAWSAASIDWNNMSAWPALDAALATTDVSSAAGWYSWEITALVQAWRAGTPNNGLAVTSADLSSTADDWAAARRLTAGDPTTSPYLDIAYRTPEPVPEPYEPEAPLLPVTGEDPTEPTDWLFLAAAGAVLGASLAFFIGRLRSAAQGG